MGQIFRVDEHDIPWSDYGDVADNQPRASIRFKALTDRRTDVPPMQYVDYAPGHEDAVHSHGTGEVIIVTAGTLHLGDTISGPGSAVYVPKDTDYAMRGGDDGLQFFRIVVP